MPSLKSKTILVVEDESAVADMYTQMLEKNGYTVITASGGVAAMQQLLNENLDLILLDLMMPDVSGLEVLRFLRREPRLQRLPVIIISAKSLAEDVDKGILAGATTYMTKPIEYRELIRAIDEALSQND